MDTQRLQTQGVLMRSSLASSALLLASLLAHLPALANDAAALPPVVLYAPSTCTDCLLWADHLRQNGFVVSVQAKSPADMPRLKRWLNVPSELTSAHTAQIGRYVVEGHVPAEDILQLLKAQPPARGLAVAGRPELARSEHFQTMLIGLDGHTSVYARH